ncbi:MAG: MogA/MoaB family molybdenum cofactor biosynthesis protein [Anaerolineae bacterium]|nr:MogA/MoaB family molybdenum cofactor biosynthesis protein [Anaerolineae bacterium]
MSEPIRLVILTASDRAAAGLYEDESGPALAKLLKQTLGATLVARQVVPDDRATLAEQLCTWADGGEVDLILVTGGTGFAPRDVTPEATRDVIEREAPGLAEAMRAASLRITAHAMLSRTVCGIRKQTLIVDLPGSPKAAVENAQVILPVLPHAIDLLRNAPESEAGHRKLPGAQMA